MTGLRLIVETPRGGEAGHRFLTSRDDMGESEVALTAAAASQNAVGRTYISVSRQVTQRILNGAVREGTERMILVGLDVGRLRPEQIEQVKSELTTLLPSLDNLIESMDWPSDNRSSVIARMELRHWVASEAFGHLPLADLTVAGSTPKSVPSPRSPQKRLLIGTLSFVLICVGMFWLFSGRQDSQTGNGNDQEPHLPLTNEERLEKLASEWQCTSKQVLCSLVRASDWDRRREADDMSLTAGLADGEVLAMLDKVAASEGSDRFYVSPIIERADGFRRFVETFPSHSAEEMRYVREWLYSAWMKFTDLKQAAEKAHNALDQDGTTDVFSQMLVSIANIQTEVGLGVSFQKPATPLFDRQDRMIYRLLNSCRIGLREEGFDQVMSEAGTRDVPSTDDLSAFLAYLRKDRAAIQREIKRSRMLVTDTIRNNRGPEDGETVFELYKAFEAFLDVLASPSNP